MRRSTATRRVVLALTLLSSPVLIGARQVDAPSANPEGQGVASAAPTFRSESELVVVHVTVRDDHGYVSDLPPQSFRLYDNGRPHPLAVVAREREPVTIGLIVDVSGSMGANRARLSYAAAKFADTGNADDEVFAIVVGDRPQPVLPADRPFTSDPQALRQAIVQAQRPGGLTALYDAIAAGLQYLEGGTHARRALVVISDGLDNASRLTRDQALMRAQASNAAIYAVGLVDPISMSRDPGHLRPLARATGGEAYFPATNADALAALDAIAREIRSAYAIGFVPAAWARDGTLHRVEVKVQPPDGRRVQVRAREAYLAGDSGAAGRAMLFGEAPPEPPE